MWLALISGTIYISLIITLLNTAQLVMSCRKYCCYIHQGVPTIGFFGKQSDSLIIH